ncbi:MAG: glycosyltransferase family 2 protein [Betaproteobacteria bacterium]|nr:glycosyltransferase family 2 protein [Betaproteobacteria bacterium]
MKLETKGRSLTVFVPALNEERDIELAVKSISSASRKVLSDVELVIVNDGSTDRTGEIADRLARELKDVRVIHHPRRRGLGAAYQSAVEAATKDYFVFIPGDNSWPHESLLELFCFLGVADVVTSYATNPWARRGGIPRRFVSAGYTKILNMLYGLRLRYFNGLTIYPVVYLKTKPVKTFGFGFAAEALLHSIFRGMSYTEIGLPIQELEGGISKAITTKNIASVFSTIARCYWEIRVRKIYGTRPQGVRVVAPRSRKLGPSL